MRLPGGISRALLVGVAIVAFRGRAILSPSSDTATGLYTSVALALRQGHLPYTTVWEYKPPGFFIPYALATMVVPPATAAWVLGTLALLLTAWAIFAIARVVDAECGSNAAWIAVAFFALLSSENDAVTSDVELEVSALVSAAIAIGLSQRLGWWRVPAAGALAGFALQCKLNAIALLPLPLIALGSIAMTARALGAYAATIVAPILAETIVYARAGAFDLLYDSNVVASVRRAHAEHGGIFSRNFGWLTGQLRILAPIIEFAAFAPLRLSGPAERIVFAWPLAALAAILAAGELYQRHFVLLAAPVALIGSRGFERIRTRLRRSPPLLARTFACVTFVLAFLLHAYFETALTIRAARADLLGHRNDRGLQDRLVRAIGAVGGKHPTLFAVDVDPFVYDLSGARALTKYRDVEHLFDPRLSAMAGVDFSYELHSIMRREPSVVIMPRTFDDYHYSALRIHELQAAVRSRYVLAQDVSGYDVYRLRRREHAAANVKPHRAFEISTPIRFDDR